MEQDKRKAPISFWELQKKQQRLSILLFGLLLLFYLLTIGLISAAVFLSLGLFLPGLNYPPQSFFLKYAFLVLLISLALTVINFLHGRKKGLTYILKSLRAYPPDPEDRYHLSFLNVVEEMKISSGLPEIKAYVIPTVNLNSLSLTNSDGVPAVVLTEGLLAEASRDELQGVVAHEVAHILKGDTFFFTLVCSFLSFYEKLIDSLGPERENNSLFNPKKPGTKETPQPLIYLASLISYLLLNFFIILISQKRELLADATAVELTRNPVSLARIIYKAHIANSYLGDSTLFTPLFLVPPDSKEINDTIHDRLFNTHPPLMSRLKILAEMAHKKVEEIIEEVKNQEELRSQSRTAYDYSEGSWTLFEEKIKELRLASQKSLEKDRIWMLKQPGGTWEGPFVLGALLARPDFTPTVRLKNIKENLEGRANEFPQVRFALYRQLRKEPVDQARLNRCPTCQSKLLEAFYEGVKIKKCPVCTGKLIAMADLEKILSRKEIRFPEALKQKANSLQESLLKTRARKTTGQEKPGAFCPECGLLMTVRPFSYHYLIPVYKCYSCGLVWFESQELELIQILVEQKCQRKA
jgi:heat shock protein HtpX